MPGSSPYNAYACRRCGARFRCLDFLGRAQRCPTCGLTPHEHIAVWRGLGLFTTLLFAGALVGLVGWFAPGKNYPSAFCLLAALPLLATLGYGLSYWWNPNRDLQANRQQAALA